MTVHSGGSYCWLILVAFFQVISPVNCARRGWTNIEPDVITCEACGARLLFSTPSSWTTQQGLCIYAESMTKEDNPCVLFSYKIHTSVTLCQQIRSP
jgi:hypothetical protein